MRLDRRLFSAFYWALTFAVAAATALGAARLHRASVLTTPINEGISSDVRLDNALELTRRVAARFRQIEEHGPLADVAPWVLQSDADFLLTGGDCGHAAGALGAVFVSGGRPFRIIQVNVGAEGAGHVMFETPDDAGQWVLLDPLGGRGFPSPQDGRLMGIDEIRALPVDERNGWQRTTAAASPLSSRRIGARIGLGSARSPALSAGWRGTRGQRRLRYGFCYSRKITGSPQGGWLPHL